MPGLLIQEYLAFKILSSVCKPSSNTMFSAIKSALCLSFQRTGIRPTETCQPWPCRSCRACATFRLLLIWQRASSSYFKSCQTNCCNKIPYNPKPRYRYTTRRCFSFDSGDVKRRRRPSLFFLGVFEMTHLNRQWSTFNQKIPQTPATMAQLFTHGQHQATMMPMARLPIIAMNTCTGMHCTTESKQAPINAISENNEFPVGGCTWCSNNY